MKNITVTIFITLVLSLIIIFILHPLNKGAVALVFVVCAGLVSLVQMLIRSRKKKTGE
jgi:hypothetical protein